MLPVQKQDDFEVVPPSLVSFADVKAVSIELLRGDLQGRVGRYDWRRSI
jgi:hypothetical protein